MNILTISNCPLIESQGSGYVITNYCRRLRERGHHVDSFGPETFELLPTLTGRAKRWRVTLGMFIFTMRQINKRPYDIVEFYGGEAWLPLLALFSKAKRSYMLISHSNGIETHGNEVQLKYLKSTTLDGSPRKWYQLDQTTLLDKTFSHVDYLVTVSKYDADYALQAGYQPKQNILAIDNPLSDDFHSVDMNLRRPPVIGFCGSWIARKGIELIKTDISKVLEEHPNCTLRIIGTDQGFQKEDHFPANICPQIENFPFTKDKKALIEFYRSLSILIAPSFYESFGLVAAEAMACGCALVASKTGFAAGLCHNYEALLMQDPISPHLYNEVKKLLIDDALRIIIAERGYQRVQSLRWDIAVDKLESAYKNWVKQRQVKLMQTSPGNL